MRKGCRRCLLCRTRAARVPSGSRSDRSQRRSVRSSERCKQSIFLRTGALCALPAACPRLSTAAADLRCIYWQELALSAQLDAAADAAPMPLREALHAMARQDAHHAQRVRTLLTGLIF